MSEISSVLSGAAAGGTTAQSGSAGGTGDLVNQDTFLKLLTTQMQNQDPMSPLQNHEMVAQLAQFSSLEQLVGMGTRLDNIYLGIASVNNASVSNLLGTEVEAVGDGVYFDGDDPTTIHWDSSADAAKSTVHVYDEDGNLVYSEELGNTRAGDNSFEWDGRTRGRGKAEEGVYRAEIISTDAEGNAVATQGRVHGMVDEMDYSTGIPRPSVGGVPVDVGSILALRSAAADDAS